MPEQSEQPHRSIDHVVFLMACGFLAPPFVAWLVLSGPNGEESAFTIFAPFASAVVLVVLLLLVEMVERRVAGVRAGWPPALIGIPAACMTAGLAFAAVDTGHHWWRDGLAGAAWGTVVAIIGWRRWQSRTQ